MYNLSLDIDYVINNTLRVLTLVLVLGGPILFMHGLLLSGNFLDQFKFPLMVTGLIMTLIGLVLIRFTLKLSYK
tara:strand:+ start:381 stop:602 length:222 start_codon:yes stop_codon:yes gene_type:complete